MAPRFSLGIDLGTSNSAIAFSEVESDQTEILEITQILGPNRIGEKPTLPSALYIPHPEEFPAGAFPLPWRTAEGGRSDHRPFRARSWRAGSRPLDHLGKVMAVEPAYRSPAAGPAVEIGDQGRKTIRVRLLSPLSRTYQGKFPLCAPQPRPGYSPGGRRGGADRPRLLRRNREKSDGGGGGSRGSRQGRLAGGAAGGVLRMDGAGRKGLARSGSAAATSCWSATSAAEPPTSA